MPLYAQCPFLCFRLFFFLHVLTWPKAEPLQKSSTSIVKTTLANKVPNKKKNRFSKHRLNQMFSQDASETTRTNPQPTQAKTLNDEKSTLLRVPFRTCVFWLGHTPFSKCVKIRVRGRFWSGMFVGVGRGFAVNLTIFLKFLVSRTGFLRSACNWLNWPEMCGLFVNSMVSNLQILVEMSMLSSIIVHVQNNFRLFRTL